MIPEYGHLSLILALFLSVVMSTVPLVGSYRQSELWMSLARPLSSGVFVFVLIAYICLTYSFVHSDFSVKYVANHSNTLLPWYYKISAVWGGHEGSLLLWVLILSTWSFAVALLSKNLPLQMVSRVSAVMGMISTGFLLFVLFTSNPFDRLLPNVPGEGSDLNPLLQDPGLIFHPPMLYMGYVGFSVAFAFAIAALLSGKLDTAWARWARPWTTAAWLFLTLGIALGSWWAYYELGWGGWWFWDPVENASFMPWLVGTALIHSLAVTEKRGQFKSWTILLAIFAFSLSLLGTFLVRSGVLTSVHAFATDPTRGLFILIFLFVVVGGSLTLYALKAPQSSQVSGYNWLSREAFLMLNNIILAIAMATVLLGTLFPLIADALNLGKYSVGPPYFNAFFVPLMSVLVLALGVGVITNWKRTSIKSVLGLLRLPLVLSAVLALCLPLFFPGAYQWLATIPVFLGSWVCLSLLADIRQKTRHRQNKFSALLSLRRSYWAMQVAHFGVAVTLVGVGINTLYSDQQDLRLSIGQRVSVGNHEFLFKDLQSVRGPNYVAQRGVIEVYRDEKLMTTLEPEKRRYLSGGNIMTEVAIETNFWRDLYVALGEELEEGSWSVRVHYKPLIMWLWLGSIFMALGGALAVADKRYRNKVKVSREVSHNESVASKA